MNRLARTNVTPNQISISSVFAAAAAAVSFVELPPIWAPIAGLCALFVWHVLDGADGDLARRTGRASASGELIDGVCDHTSQALVYVSLAIVLQRSLGFWAWPLAVAAALSHAVQSNAYETGRKTYRHWVYQADWMRQRPDVSRSLAGLANRGYLAAAAIFSPNEEALETAMHREISRGREFAAKARNLYGRHQVELVKRSGLLGSTGRSLAVAASFLAGTPLWFFLYEIAILNVALVAFVMWRARVNIRVIRELGRLGSEL